MNASIELQLSLLPTEDVAHASALNGRAVSQIAAYCYHPMAVAQFTGSAVAMR